ncbi:DUF397 domain-containing protein [Thermoactinospora rubra]|uniref:DUF397 domain-containing protein n=1 Tax=Thermoactinospora rubra TaxID=1088767 RepID=UPI000A0FB55B|nr:DUF397 domain-containing protein [Thermoactinospora rubra]
MQNSEPPSNLPPSTLWKKSSRCAQNGNCVEVMTRPDHSVILLRNSTKPDIVLKLTLDDYAQLIAAIKQA